MTTIKEDYEELKNFELEGYDMEFLENGKVEITDAYMEIVAHGNLEEFIKNNGERIHHNGTEELVSYYNEELDKNVTLRLDVLDDFKTPNFHVKINSDYEYLEIYDTYEEAKEDFVSIVNGMI